MALSNLLLLVWAHFLGDFILQSDKMACNKSSSIFWLTVHSLVYAIPLVAVGGITFGLWNSGAHFCVDFCTSRINKYFWNRDKRHWFFTGISFDQALHATILFCSYILFIGR